MLLLVYISNIVIKYLSAWTEKFIKAVIPIIMKRKMCKKTYYMHVFEGHSLNEINTILLIDHSV